jgi:hypothetical protein
MPFKDYSAKQKKLARVAAPRDAITGEDFKELRKAGGGMVKFQGGGDIDVRVIELEEMLNAAREAGNDDLVEELESDLFKERGYKDGGRVKGYRHGMSVSSDGMGRGCGAAVKGKKFSGTF